MALFGLGNNTKQTPTSTNKRVNFDSLPHLLTIEQVSEILGVHPNTLRNWDRSGRLTAIRIGARQDRRYERESIQRLYHELQPSHTPPVPSVPPSIAPTEKSYVLEPGFSWRWIQLYLMSRKFSLYIFSVLLVAFSFAVVQVSFFAYIYIAQAEEAPEVGVVVLPATATGWETTAQALSIDLLPTAPLSEFADTNAAHFHIALGATDEPGEPITIEQDIELEDSQVTIEEESAVPLNESTPELRVSKFTVPDGVDAASVITQTDLRISLAVDGAPESEDVLLLEYSIDNGVSWLALESMVLSDDLSNAIHGGYFEYPIGPFDAITDIATVQFRAHFSSGTMPTDAVVWIDGVELLMETQRPDPVVADIEQSVAFVTDTDMDLTADEQPVISVETQETSSFAFIGVEPTVRDIGAVTITGPDGETHAAPVTIAETTTGNNTIASLAIDPSTLSAPGQYSVTVTVEQDGRSQEVVYAFTWGALALNTDQAQYRLGETAVFSLGAVDDTGHTICTADMRLTVTDPAGRDTILTSADGTIQVTDNCYVKDLYQGPDYAATYVTTVPGTYQVSLVATVNGEMRTLTDAFSVTPEPEFRIKRDGPTRVFPNVNQPMRIEFTPADSFTGTVRELVPGNFDVYPENGGKIQPYDTGTMIIRSIVWDISLQAGTSATLGYTFKSPEKSPALYALGPVMVGDWTEGRAWQLVIDPAYMYLLGNSATAPTGWTNDTTTFAGYYPRGAATTDTTPPTGGATTHTDTVSGYTNSTGAQNSFVSPGVNVSTGTHTHGNNALTVGSANNDPLHHTFYLWKSNITDPTTIPINAFAFFDTAPTGNWSRFTAADNRLIRIAASNTTGGTADTHTHSLTWGSLTAASGTVSVFDDVSSGASTTHTHTAPVATTSTSYTLLPSYIQSLIYQATANNSPPQNLIAMWDAAPPTGWTTVSGASQTYSGQYARGSATYSATPQSANTHSMANQTSGNSGVRVGTALVEGLGGTGVATSTHTHTTTASFTANTDHQPQYFDVIMAECTNGAGCGPGATITVSGSIYSDEGSTKITAAAKTVVLWVNGSATACGGGACTAESSAGDYTISNVTAASGDVLTLFLDNETEKATTFLVSNGATVSTAHLYQNRVILRHDTGASITNANIESGDRDATGETDILAEVATSNLTVDSNYELHIWTGGTQAYDPGGTVTTQGTGDLHVDDNASAYLDTASNVIAQNVAIDTGATLYGQNTTTVNGATNAGVSAVGTLNISAGTFTVGNGTDEDVTLNAGTLTVSGGTLTVKDQIKTTSGGSAETVNITGGTTNAQGVGTTTAAPLYIPDGTITIGGGGGTATVNTSGNLYQTGGTLNVNTNSDINVTGEFQMPSGSPILELNGGSMDTSTHWRLNAGTINLDGGSHHTGNDGIVEMTNGGNAVAFNMTGGDLYVRGLLVYNSGTLTTSTCSGGNIHLGIVAGASINYYLVNTSASFQIYNLLVDQTGFINDGTNQTIKIKGSLTVANSMTFTITNTSQSHTLQVDGGWVNNGTVVNSNTGAFRSTVILRGGNVSGTNDTPFNHLQIGDSGTSATVTVNGTDDPTVTGTMTVDTTDTLSIGASRFVTHSGGTYTLNGTVSGAGTMTFTNASPGPGATGSLTSTTRYDATNGDVASTTVDVRMDYMRLEFYSNTATARTITLAAGTYVTGVPNGHVYVMADGASPGNLTLQGATNNPTMDIAYSLDFTGVGTASEIINSGTGTWQVGEHVNFTDGTYTATAGNTLDMDGIGTLTSAAQTMQNLSLTGTITLANATHTVAGNLNLAGGYTGITAGTSTIAMTGTSNTIVGENETLNNLTIDPSSVGTITLQTSSLTASGTLTVAAGDTLSINANMTMSNTGAAEVAGTGVISGAGTLRFTSASGGPGTTIAQIGAIVRYDASNGNIAAATIDARSYDSLVEFYSGSATARTATLNIGTYMLGALYVIANGATPGDLTLVGATNNPTVTIVGTLDFTGTGTASEVITSGTGTWTVSGNVDFTGGTYTAATNNTLVMDGLSTTNIYGNGQSLYNFSVAPSGVGVVAMQTSNLTVTGTFTLSGTCQLTINAGLSFTLASTGTLTRGAGCTIAGTGTFIYQPATYSETSGVSSGVRFDATNNAQTINGSVTFGGAIEFYTAHASIGRTITLGNAVGRTFTFNSTVTLTAAGAAGLTVDANTQDPNLTFTGAVSIGGASGGSATLSTNNANTLAFNGGVTINTTGVLTTNGSTVMTIAGNYTNNGTFNHGAGTVTLNGSGTQTLSGTMTGGSAFNNLIVTNASADNPDIIFATAATTAATFTATTAGSQIRFLAGATYTFQNITLNGQATGTRVALTSSSVGTQWNINVAGTRAVSNTSVQDSYACGQSPNILANDGTNLGLGNNSCWTFSGIIISGTANGNVGATVRYAVNGTLRNELGLIGASSTWTIEGVTAPATADEVIVWIDNIANINESSAVTSYDGTSDITGMVLDTHVLTLGSDDNQSISQGVLEVVYDNFFDEDIMFRCPIVASCTLDVDDDNVYTDERLVIRSGTTLVMGANDDITTHDIQIDGTLTAGSGSITVSGSWDNNNDYNTSSETIYFTSTTTETIDSTGAVDADVFNVAFNGVGGQWTLNSALVVNGDVTITNGTVNANNNLTVTGGDLTGDGTLTYTAGTPTVSLGNAAGNFGGANPWTLNNLTLAHTPACGSPVTTAVGAGSVTINGTLTLQADISCVCTEFDCLSHNLNLGSKTWIFTASGTPFVADGEFIGSTSIVRYTGTGATTIANTNPNITDYYNTLQLQPASGTPTYTLLGANGYEVRGDLTISTSVNLTVTGSTVYMRGTGALDAGGKTLNNLTVNPAAAQTVTVQTNDVTVAGTLNVGANGVMSISSGRTVNWTGATFTLAGTISGAGTLRIDSSGVIPATGTLSSIVRLDATNGITAVMYARTYGGRVEIYSNSGIGRTVTLQAGTHTITGASSHLYVISDGASPGDLTLAGATNSPTVNIGGSLDFTGVGTSSEVVTSGTGTWTVSGSVDFTGGTYTAAAGNILVMDGVGTLTSAGQTLQNLTLSGSITLANATHTVNGNLSLAGSTITAGSSTVLMTGTSSNTIVGGGQSLNILTIDPSSGATITLQTSDLTVAGLLTVAASDTLSIASGITLSNTSASDVAGTGTISGAGTLRFTNASGGPGTTITTLSAVVRFDATSGNIATTTLDVRTYSGRVEFYSSSSSARTATFAAGSYTISGASSHLYVMSDGASPGDLTLAGATNNPTVNIGGSLDYTGVGTASEVITSGTGTWTVGGSVDFTGGTFTAAAGNTLIMNGTGTLTSASQILQHLTLSGTITLANSTHTVNGNLNLTGGSTTAGSSTVTMTGTSNTITGGSKTLNNLNIDPSSAGTITLQTSDLTVGGTLTVASGDIFSVNAGRILNDTGAADVAGTGTISGAGTLRFTDTSGGPGTTITTISLPTQYDATNGNIAGTTVDARTHTNQVTFISTSTTARSITLGAGTFILSGASSHWYIAANGASPGDLSVTGDSNNPTVTIGGDLDFTGVGSSSESLTTGSGTWTVSGNANFGGGTFTPSTNNTFIMDGTSKTATESTLSGLPFYNFRSSGSITFSTLVEDAVVLNDLTIDSAKSLTGSASGYTSIGHNFTNNGGTFNANSGTVGMYGSAGAINGSGSTTFNNLTIVGGPGSTTMSNADNTVAGTLTVDTGDTLSLASGRTMSVTGAANVAGTGSITGAGTLRFTDTSGGPGTTITTLSAITRYDATNGNIASTTLDARTYGQLEFYMTGTTARTATFALGTYTLSGAGAHLYMIDNGSGAGTLTVDGSVNNPVVTIGGNFGSTGSYLGGGTVASGTGAWTVSGNVDFIGMIFTATTGNSFTMNGASASLNPNFNSLYNFSTAGSGTITLLSLLWVNNNVSVGDTSTFTSVESLTIEGSSLTGTGTVTFTGGTVSIRGDGGSLGGSNSDWTFYNLKFTLNSSCYVTCSAGCTRLTASAGGSGAMIIQSTIRTETCSYGFGESTAVHRFDAGSKTWILQGSGTGASAPLYNTYFNYNTSTFRFTGTGTTDIAGIGTSYYNYELLPASGTPMYNYLGATVYGNAVIGTAVNFVHGSNGLYMYGDGKTIDAGGKTLYDFYVYGANNTVTVINNDFSVAGLLHVETGDTLSINASRTLSDTGAVNVAGTGTISGAGTLRFTDTSGGPGTTATISTPVRFDASAGNIVAGTLDARTYGGAVEVYGNNSSNSVTAPAGTFIFSSTLTTTQGGTGATTLNFDTNDPTVTVSGALTIGPNTIVAASSSATFNVNGNYTNSGTFTDSGGTVTLGGSSQQTLSGSMTSTSNDFNNLIVTNVSGTDPDTSPSVIFAAGADTAGTFTAATANTKLRFNAGSTYTVQNISFNGQATGTRVFLRSSSSGTQWNINVAGTRAVSYTNVRDSDACGQAPTIDASDGTNVDATNNDCWFVYSVSFSISDTTIGFGSLSATQSRYATGDGTGSAGEVEAHTLSAATNGAGGYVITVNGTTLTSAASDTITYIGGINTAPSFGTEQFGIRATASGGSGAVSAPYAAAGFAYDLLNFPDELASAAGASATTTYSLRYLGNISVTTEAGTYGADITYIMIPKF